MHIRTFGISKTWRLSYVFTWEKRETFKSRMLILPSPFPSYAVLHTVDSQDDFFRHSKLSRACESTQRRTFIRVRDIFIDWCHACSLEDDLEDYDVSYAAGNPLSMIEHMVPSHDWTVSQKFTFEVLSCDISARARGTHIDILHIYISASVHILNNWNSSLDFGECDRHLNVQLSSTFTIIFYN